MAHPALARLADDLSDRECPTYCLLGLLPGAPDSRALSFDPPGPALVLPRLGRRCHFKALIRVASSAVRVAPQQGELRQAREAVDAVAPGHPAGRRRMLDDVVGFFQGLAGAREIALHHEPPWCQRHRSRGITRRCSRATRTPSPPRSRPSRYCPCQLRRSASRCSAKAWRLASPTARPMLRARPTSSSAASRRPLTACT